MNITATLGVVGLSFLVANAASAESKTLDPGAAPIAAVDRFSDKAAHLQLRKPGNGIPGPNEPVDFDTGPFITHGFSPSGKPIRYYNFDVQGTTPARVYVLYRDGENSPVSGQLDIIDTLPGDSGYNDFREVWNVQVPRAYVANSVGDASDLTKEGFKIQKTDVVRNMPIVPDKSVARLSLKGGGQELHSAWYNGSVAKYFEFDEAKLSASGGSVPVSPIYVTFNANPNQPNGGPDSGFKTEPNSLQTHNVPSTLPGQSGYSPLWWVVVYDNADWGSVHDLSSATKAKILGSGVATVNCPIVAITP
jgi:hypothetical protein